MNWRSAALILLCSTALGLAVGGCGGGDDGSSEDAQATRTVKHALGTTEVPVDPKRIVVLNEFAILDALTALGIEPVGSTGNATAEYPYGIWLEGETPDMELVGSAEEPSFEKILALEPDLIIANPWQKDIYGKLSEIAPTIAPALDYTNYEKEFLAIAAMFGKESEAAEIEAAHKERLSEFRENAATSLGGQTVSVARTTGTGLMVEGWGYVTHIFEAAGLKRPAGHAVNGKDLELSLEQLGRIDGDHLFVYTSGGDSDVALEELTKHPLWGTLTAVKNDHVYPVDSAIWSGGGMLWADKLLDDLTTNLTP